jgi:hypothetical protein
VYASDAEVYGPPLVVRRPASARCTVFSRGAENAPGALAFELRRHRRDAGRDAGLSAITPDTHAKYLLTSAPPACPRW